jgi:hypothetical protein
MLSPILILLFAIHSVFGATTNFVDKNSKIKTFAEKEWFLENMPYVEVPHKQIEEVRDYQFLTYSDLFLMPY